LRVEHGADILTLCSLGYLKCPAAGRPWSENWLKQHKKGGGGERLKRRRTDCSTSEFLSKRYFTFYKTSFKGLTESSSVILNQIDYYLTVKLQIMKNQSSRKDPIYSGTLYMERICSTYLR
jgi:hypothetical protein